MKAKNTNFIDYVKIFCRSGKGVPVALIFIEVKQLQKGAQMEVMEEMEEISF